MPVGFVLNDVQYYYVTDLSGNIKGITDANGKLVASYKYDEWGKLLALTPAEDGNEEQIAVATKNPLRYRGYYYDNETGLYYLQSRYYSPDLCRFISPDDFDYINNSSMLYLNAYAYCYNNAVSLSDAEGTTPQLAMNVADISAFVKHIGAKVKETAKESLEKAKSLLNKTVEKLKEMWAKLEEKRSQAIKDLKYFVKNPDVVISQKLSKLFHKEVKVRFRVLEYIRATLHKKRASKYYMLGNLLIDDDCLSKKDKDSESNSTSKAKVQAKAKSKNDDSNNIVNAILQGLIAAIELDWINEILKEIGSSLDNLAKKAHDQLKFEENIKIVLACFNNLFVSFKDYFSKNGATDALSASSHLFGGSFKSFANVISIIASLIGFVDGSDNPYNSISDTDNTIINVANLLVGIFVIFLPFSPAVSAVASIALTNMTSYLINTGMTIKYGLIFLI